MEKVFISYSWDSEDHKEWVLKLANRLTKDEVFVFLDQYDLKAGNNITYFMENAIKESSKVLIILTPNYCKKADERKGGVGFEYSIINSKLFTNQLDNNKYIPILKHENKVNSIPIFLEPFIFINMSKEELVETAYEELLRIINNQPKIIRPTLNKKVNQPNKKAELRKYSLVFIIFIIITSCLLQININPSPIHLIDNTNNTKWFEELNKTKYDFYNIGYNLVENKLDPKNAILNFNKAIEIDSNFVEAYYARGTCYYQIGMFKYALVDLYKAASMGHVSSISNIGWTYWDIEEYIKAESVFKKSLEIKLTGNNKELIALDHCGLAITYFKLKNFQKAKEELQNAISLNSIYDGNFDFLESEYYFTNRQMDSINKIYRMM